MTTIIKVLLVNLLMGSYHTIRGDEGFSETLKSINNLFLKGLTEGFYFPQRLIAKGYSCITKDDMVLFQVETNNIVYYLCVFIGILLDILFTYTLCSVTTHLLNTY